MVSSIYELLDQCTVKLTSAKSKAWGTGFFVSADKVITCAHVVHDLGTEVISVIWQGKEWATAKVEQIKLSPIDLALLQVEVPEGELPPCVLLGEGFNPFDRLYVYGYPDNFQDGGSVTIHCEGTVKDGGVTLIIAQAGQVRPGHSGSPALNDETGKVCGIVSETRGRSTDLGGLLIPISTVFSQFPELRTQNEEVHKQDRRWLNFIDQRTAPSIPKSSIVSHQDWGDAPDVSVFFGRTEELVTLEKWIVKERCQVVAILGMGGMGKTALAAKLAEQIKGQFDYFIWLSLRNKIGSIVPIMLI
jgi:hypothetical protein